MFMGIILETSIGIGLMESSWLWKSIGSRPLPWNIFFCNGLPFSMLILVWEEIRKFMIRNSSKWMQLNFGW